MSCTSASMRAEPLPPPPKKVVVLGAGYAGLAAATELTLRGHDVTLVEGRVQAQPADSKSESAPDESA